MSPRPDQHLTPDAAEGVSPGTKHGFMHTLRKSLSSISLSSRKSPDIARSNTSGPRQQPQGASNIYDDTFDISLVPMDEFASVLRGALASPGQDYTSPYPNYLAEHVRRSHSMCDLSERTTRAVEVTDSTEQPSPCPSHQPDLVDAVLPSHESVASLSARTPHCREARIPLSSSVANMRIALCEDSDEPSEACYSRISMSYDWLFNSPLGQRPNDFGTEAMDLIGPDPFRWVPTRAQVSELQKALQVPESTASGALALTTSTSQDQMSLTPKVRRVKLRDKRRREAICWSPEPPTFTEDRTLGGEGKGKARVRQMGGDQYPETRL